MPVSRRKASHSEFLRQCHEQNLISDFYKLLQQSGFDNPIVEQLVFAVLKYLTACYGLDEDQRHILTIGFHQNFQELLLTLCQQQFGFTPGIDKIKQLEKNLLATFKMGTSTLIIDDFVIRMIADIHYHYRIHGSILTSRPLYKEIS